MCLKCSHDSGFTLIELMITLAVLGILISLAVPEFRLAIQNAQIRRAAESAMNGINLARAEALRRNAVVRFQLVDSLSAACALSSTGTSWVVSRGNPAGLCDVAPAAPTDSSSATGSDPKTIQRYSGAGAATVTLNASTSAGAAATTIAFDGFGRIAATSLASAISTIAVDSNALPASDSRDLRLTITTAGQVRLCDPAVSDTADPRHC